MPRVPRRHRVRAAHRMRLGRHLPHDVTVSWPAAHTLSAPVPQRHPGANPHPRSAARTAPAPGRRRRPTAADVDASSVKASPVAGPRGFDGAKKVDGRQMPCACRLGRCAGRRRRHRSRRGGPRRTPEAAPQGETDRANHQSRIGGQGLHRSDRRRRGQRWPHHCGGLPTQARTRLHRPTAGSSNAQTAINHYRRIDRHNETTPASHEGLVNLNQIAQPLRRLNRSQLFDTL